MTNLKPLILLLVITLVIPFYSCDDDDVDRTIGTSILESATITDILEKNSDASSLKAALETASGDLLTTLDGDGPFTVFAPTNAAFDNLATLLGFESASELLSSASPDMLASILTYHVVAGDLAAGDFTDGSSVTTVNGGDLLVVVDGDNVQLLDATETPLTNPVSTVTGSNPDPVNGIIHVIDKVLLPQEAVDAFSVDTSPTIVDLAISTDNLSVLVSALDKVGLTGTIVGLDSASVLAPNNDAFTALLDDLGDDYNSLDDFDNAVEIGVLTDILTYHVLPGTIELETGPVDTAFEGQTVEVVADGDGFALGDATATNAGIVDADVEAKNGAVQIIDKVLLPQSAVDFQTNLASNDLTSIVVAEPGLSILEEALLATELTTPFVDDTNESFVQGEDEEDEDFEARRTPENFTYFKPATVFAPSDAAFQALFDVLGDEYTGIESFDTEDELALLEEILLYHVVEGAIESGNLAAGPVTTLAESDIEIIAVLGTEGFVIGDASNNENANIIIPDVMARNGVAHIIDKVLLTQNAVDFIISTNEAEDME